MPVAHVVDSRSRKVKAVGRANACAYCYRLNKNEERARAFAAAVKQQTRCSYWCASAYGVASSDLVFGGFVSYLADVHTQFFKSFGNFFRHIFLVPATDLFG